MAKNLIYPISPESPKYLLKLALSNGFKSTSLLLFTSVLGCWILAMASYLSVSHLESPTTIGLLNIATVLLILLFSLVGIIQCDAAYAQKTLTTAQAYAKLVSKLLPVCMTIAVYILILMLFTWIAGSVLQMVFQTGTMTLGLVRILIGFVYIFFLVSTFFILPYQVTVNKPVLSILGHVLPVSMVHWLRCFLCLMVWLITMDLLVGEFAYILVPALIKIPYSMIVVKTVVTVLGLPVLISYTTLLAHDLNLRAK